MQLRLREPSLGGRCSEREGPGAAEAEGVRGTMCTKFEEDMKEKALNELVCVCVGGFIHVAKNINGTLCTQKYQRSQTERDLRRERELSEAEICQKNDNELKPEAPA